METKSIFNHVRNTHDVKISNTEITKVLEKPSITVNSFHNNIIYKNNLGKNHIHAEKYMQKIAFQQKIVEN